MRNPMIVIADHAQLVMDSWNNLSRSDKKLTTTDVEIYLPNMHIGETRRDASPGVRGFLFQDLLAINELIKEETEYICSEYIEDVVAVTSNAVRVIQSKYTPRTDLDIKEITRELYYQYIKLRHYGYRGNIIPVLGFHANMVTKPNEKTAKMYLNLPAEQQQFQGTSTENISKVLRCTQVGSKEERENNLFASFYGSEELKEYLSAFQMEEVSENIGSFRKMLSVKLDALIDKNCSSIGATEERQELLIALATKLIQDRYNEPNQPEDNHELLLHRKIQRQDFISGLKQSLASEPSLSIVILSFIDETYCELADEQLASENRIRLNGLYVSTNRWAKAKMESHNGIIQLLNTVSTDISVPSEIDESQVIRQVLFTCKNVIKDFFLYVWKIKLDLKQDTFEECLLSEISEYIAFSFQKQKDWSKRSIVMGTVDMARPRTKLLNVQKRLRACKDRPQKWYLRNPYGGLGDYSINTVHITPKKLNVTSISPEQFALECMECIHIEAGEWATTENCLDCIFSYECINGGLL